MEAGAGRLGECLKDMKLHSLHPDGSIFRGGGT